MNGFKLNLIFPIALLVVADVSWASADLNCAPNSIGYDVCEAGEKIASSLAEVAPIKMSQNMVLEKAMSIDQEVHAFVVFTYDKMQLSKILDEGGVTVDDAKEWVEASSSKRVCSDEKIAAFVELGGEIVYQYHFVDGEKFLEVKIDSCG